MPKRALYTQESLNAELRGFEEVLGNAFCELVEGEVPDDLQQEVIDHRLRATLRGKVTALLEHPEEPQFILYQLPAGQQSLICLSMDENGKLLIGYRDLDSRPPTKRVRESIDHVVKEINSKEGKE